MLVKEKLLKIPAELWAQIEEYRDATGQTSDQKAILSLIGLGLAKNRETLEALKKGKKR